MIRRFHHRRSPQAPFRPRRTTTCLAFGAVFLLLLVTALGSGWAAPALNVESGLEFELHMVDAAGPADPWTKIAGDLDGDGRDELIVGGQQVPLVWYGSPDFKKHTIAEGGWNTVSGAVGDVDGDGDRDVLLGGSIWLENPGISSLRRTNFGSFIALPTTPPTTSQPPISMVMAGWTR